MNVVTLFSLIAFLIMCFCSCWMYDKQTHTHIHINGLAGGRVRGQATLDIVKWTEYTNDYFIYSFVHFSIYYICYCQISRNANVKFENSNSYTKTWNTHVFIYVAYKKKSRRSKRNTCPCYLTLIRENNSNGNRQC